MGQVVENEFPPQTKWVGNNPLLGYESSEFGYETTVGTKQLVSGHPHPTPLDSKKCSLAYETVVEHRARDFVVNDFNPLSKFRAKSKNF